MALTNTQANGDTAVAVPGQGSYVLPGDVDRDVYIIPVSGGADSAALAIVLHRLFPHVPFRLVYTDPGADEPEIAEALGRLATLLGKPVEHVNASKSLWELIDEYNGFLPSPTDRYCTRVLKLEPFKKWIEQFAGRRKFVFVGIRSDESTRVAFVIDEADTEMPFLDLAIGRTEVFETLAESVGIPGFYSRRSRSGCSCCPFQRRQERVGLLQQRPIEFRRALERERLPADDCRRHAPAPRLVDEVGIGDWVALTLPLPPANAELSGSVGMKGRTVFGDVGIFVAAEFFLDGFPGGQPFVWRQRLLTYSTTLAGLKRQVQTRFEHLLATAEVHEMTPAEVRTSVRFAAYYLEAPSGAFDPAGPGPGSYTWHDGESYLQLSHVIGWAARILGAHHLEETVRRAAHASPVSWLYECGQSSLESLQCVKHPVGRLVASGWVATREPALDSADDADPRSVVCPMCSL